MAVERFPVEAGHVERFARSIGDTNPIYSDPEHAASTEVGHVIAPPTFAQASAQFDPDYPLRWRPDREWFGSGGSPTGRRSEGSGDSDGGSGGGGAAGTLHAEQHFTYHRHLRPGDVLTVSTRPGESWTKEGRRGGRLHFSETITEYRDADGELVVTARGVGVRTEKVIEGEG